MSKSVSEWLLLAFAAAWLLFALAPKRRRRPGLLALATANVLFCIAGFVGVGGRSAQYVFGLGVLGVLLVTIVAEQMRMRGASRDPDLPKR
ncbi:MAG TPA: hypothetical protein VJR92_01300 [Gemmatimonadaceae bacterium]|nr:hypothetical protein [Gemmatimonadaceae bacterium]